MLFVSIIYIRDALIKASFFFIGVGILLSLLLKIICAQNTKIKITFLFAIPKNNVISKIIQIYNCKNKFVNGFCFTFCFCLS
ncbi:hypothetical protein BHE82_01105 [Rice orange leaf phytoplasma]|nr:hypothetical protein BHE82_01105 [Rice orange leaf phytoplasma]